MSTRAPDDLLDHYRTLLRASLTDLGEEEARRLGPSKITLLGLLKHAIYVEGFWFDEALTGRTARQVGIATSPDRSFTLTKSDTIASVLTAHQHRCEQPRTAVAAPPVCVAARQVRSADSRRRLPAAPGWRPEGDHRRRPMKGRRAGSSRYRATASRSSRCIRTYRSCSRSAGGTDDLSMSLVR